MKTRNRHILFISINNQNIAARHKGKKKSQNKRDTARDIERDPRCIDPLLRTRIAPTQTSSLSSGDASICHLAAFASCETPCPGLIKTLRPMSGNARELSPLSASFSSSNLDKYVKLNKSTKDSKADLNRQKPAKQTKATRPAKRLPKSTVRVPRIDDRSEVGDGSGEWFAIRDIVDEKVERGVRQYLIDWDDHPVTGEVYPKSWVQLTSDCAQTVWKLSIANSSDPCFRRQRRSCPSLAGYQAGTETSKQSQAYA